MRGLKWFFGFAVLALTAAATRLMTTCVEGNIESIATAALAVIICSIVLIAVVLSLFSNLNRVTGGAKIYMETERKCKDCGGKVIAGATFCHRCGRRIDNAGNMTEELMLGYKWHSQFIKGAPWALSIFLVSFCVARWDAFMSMFDTNATLGYIVGGVVFLTAVNVVFSTAVSGKSKKGDYDKFLRLLKAELIFEIISVSLIVTFGIKTQGFTVPFVFDIWTLVILGCSGYLMYRFWYLLNVGYFTDRRPNKPKNPAKF